MQVQSGLVEACRVQHPQWLLHLHLLSGFVYCTSFLGLLEQNTTGWGLKQQKFTVLQFGKLEAWDQVVSGAGAFRGWEGETVPCLLLSFWGLAGNLWHPLVCSSITLVSAFMFTWFALCVHAYAQMSLLYKDSQLHWTGAHPTPVWPNLNYIFNNSFTSKVTFWDMEGGGWS